MGSMELVREGTHMNVRTGIEGSPAWGVWSAPPLIMTICNSTSSLIMNLGSARSLETFITSRSLALDHER